MNNTTNHSSSTQRLHVLTTLVQKVDAGLLDLLNQRANILKTIAEEHHHESRTPLLHCSKPLLEKDKHSDISEEVVQAVWGILNQKN